MPFKFLYLFLLLHCMSTLVIQVPKVHFLWGSVLHVRSFRLSFPRTWYNLNLNLKDKGPSSLTGLFSTGVKSYDSSKLHWPFVYQSNSLGLLILAHVLNRLLFRFQLLTILADSASFKADRVRRHFPSPLPLQDVVRSFKVLSYG